MSRHGYVLLHSELVAVMGMVNELAMAVTEARARASYEKQRADSLADETAVLRYALGRADGAASVRAEQDIAQRRGERQDSSPGTAGAIRQQWCGRHGCLPHRWIEGAWRCQVCGEPSAPEARTP